MWLLIEHEERHVREDEHTDIVRTDVNVSEHCCLSNAKLNTAYYWVVAVHTGCGHGNPCPHYQRHYEDRASVTHL